MDDNTATKIINKTIADYNLIAAKFSSTRQNISSDLLDIANHINKDESLLDYGCGNGRMARFFDPDKYLGVDASSSLLNIAKSTYPQHHFEHIKPCEIKSDWHFQNIICLSMIHHLPAKDYHHKLLSNFYHLLADKGMLIITAWDLGSQHKNNHNIVHKPFSSQDLKIDRELYAFEPSELDKRVLESGFKIISSKISPRNRGAYSNIEVVAIKS